MIRNDFGPIFWMHWGFVALFYVSPFLFSWEYIMAGFAVLVLQDLTLGYCVLSRWQFKNRPRVKGFFHYYFTKWHFRDPDGLIRVIERSRPLVAAFAVVLQTVGGFHPFIV